jgi:hypothetical protein
MAGEQRAGSKDTTEYLIHVLHHALQGAKACERDLQEAAQSGDGELVALLREWRDTQHHLAQRVKALLATRLASAHPVVSVEPDASEGYRLRSSPGAQTNARVRSGGREGDDLVDEQSKESFPASDSPAH